MPGVPILLCIFHVKTAWAKNLQQKASCKAAIKNMADDLPLPCCDCLLEFSPWSFGLSHDVLIAAATRLSRGHEGVLLVLARTKWPWSSLARYKPTFSGRERE